jgi:hypothetical protein
MSWDGMAFSVFFSSAPRERKKVGKVKEKENEEGELGRKRAATEWQRERRQEGSSKEKEGRERELRRREEGPVR